MEIQETNDPGKILIDCSQCGNMFPVDDFRSDELEDVTRQAYELYRLCPDCESQKTKLQQEAEAQARREEFEAKLPELLIQSGIGHNYSHDRTTGKLFKEPPCRYLAEWIFRNRNRNLLISGTTGTGKSTSAAFIAAMLIRDGKAVVYTTLRKLLSDWKTAKTSDRDFAPELFLKTIFRSDLFIIDEFVGKSKISESGQELLFELLESVNSGNCSAKIWLMGNFFGGSIETIFSDPQPVRRRLQENFSCVYADKKTQTINPLTVWEEQ